MFPDPAFELVEGRVLHAQADVDQRKPICRHVSFLRQRFHVCNHTVRRDAITVDGLDIPEH